MSTERARTISGDLAPEGITSQEKRIAVEGLEDLFKWASEMVADGEDARVKSARENRIRRQVLETIQTLRESQAVAKATEEVAYLQRRVIALLQKLQEATEENAALKSVMVAQAYALERIPRLEEAIRDLREVEFDRQAAAEQRRQLLNALSKLKVDRDFLDELLRASEDENARLARLLADTRAEVDRLTSRRWWHWLLPVKG